MLVVSDTSPLTALLQIGRAEVLRELFGRVLIPIAVQKELLRGHLSAPPWVEVRSVNAVPRSLLEEGLDRGETEAIALALEIEADVLLIDERRGRRAAAARGLKVTGLLGVLVLAKQRGHLLKVRPVIDELQRIAGCWFDAVLIEDVCRAAGE